MPIPTYEPLNSFKKISDNIWIVDGDIIKMDFVVTNMPFSTRMTIVKLTDDTLWIHSPIKGNEELYHAINQLGEVKHLISPNKIHYAYINEWKERYPQAIAWSSPGVEDRAKSQNIPVDFDQALSDESPEIWSKDIDQLIFKGSRYIEEVVFLHKSSRTLILTDLIENFEIKNVDNLFFRTLFKIAGIADPDGMTPRDIRLTFFGNKAIARRSYQQMLAWQPDKIILAHGRWYDKDGTAELQRAFRWLK